MSCISDRETGRRCPARGGRWAGKLRDTRRMCPECACAARKLEGMYVRTVAGSGGDAFGTDEDDDADLAYGAADGAAVGGGTAASGLAVVGERVRAARALLDRPLTSYYLIVGITTLLLGLGLVMVLSTASVADLYQGESPYYDFVRQLAGILVGL